MRLRRWLSYTHWSSWLLLVTGLSAWLGFGLAGQWSVPLLAIIALVTSSLFMADYKLKMNKEELDAFSEKSDQRVQELNSLCSKIVQSTKDYKEIVEEITTGLGKICAEFDREEREEKAREFWDRIVDKTVEGYSGTLERDIYNLFNVPKS